MNVQRKDHDNLVIQKTHLSFALKKKEKKKAWVYERA
jgi:hypothetical protein